MEFPIYEVGKTGTEVLIDAARMVSWHFSLEIPCYPPGDYFKTVLEALTRADPIQFHRMQNAYPIHALFVNMVQGGDPRGVEIVKAIARIGAGEQSFTAVNDDPKTWQEGAEQ